MVQYSRGLINDSISDMLTRIRNANLAKKSNVSIPYTKLNLEIAQILEKEGFIQSFQIGNFQFSQNMSSQAPIGQDSQEVLGENLSNEILIRLKYRSKKVYRGKTKESCITNLKRISKPGLRIYTNSREIPRILGGTGIVILSTPSGIMTDREARSRGIGGELLCSVW